MGRPGALVSCAEVVLCNNGNPAPLVTSRGANTLMTDVTHLFPSHLLDPERSARMMGLSHPVPGLASRKALVGRILEWRMSS